MKCKKCGFENSSDSAFCVNCGSPIEKNDFKKCIVCGSDIEDDALFCPTCGSKQDDYIKCSVCGEACLKTFKFCTRCGTPFDGSDSPYSKTANIDKIEPIISDTTNFDDVKPTVSNTPDFDKVEPVNNKPIVNIPDNSSVDTNTNPTGPILDNTEVYNTIEIKEPKKSTGKIVLIIFACIFALALIALLVIFVFKIFVKNDEVVVEHKEKEETVEVIDNKDTTVEKQEEKTEVIVETTKTVSYYKIKFLDTIKIRTAPSLDGEHIGKVSKGSSLIAFEKQNADGYTWYRISYNEWVADDGSFLSVSDYEREEVDLYSQNGSMVRLSKDTSIYDSPSSSGSTIGSLSKSTLISIYDTIKDNNTTWYKISPCGYINASDAYFE